VLDPSSLQAARDACLSAFGRIDILVAAATSPPAAPTLSLDEPAWRQALDTNVTGMLRAIQVFGEPMVSRKYGRVVAIGAPPSAAGLAGAAAFASSNAAIAGLMRALAIEWGAHGVTVNAIAPGVFSTPDTAAWLEGPPGLEFLMRAPVKRFGTLDELVGAILFLSSDASSFVTGHVLAVDGGYAASGVNR
jgi:NAD(P)-dependent dehydrogenase (short-subunit alcohol dehydrogenase family)